MRYLLSMVILGLGSTALAVMPPSVYRDAAKRAAFHVQVKVDKVTVPKRTPGECLVSGKVVRIFRGKLKRGSAVRFAVSCRAAGDKTPMGGTIWTAVDQLKRAKYIEAALNRHKKSYVVARWNSSIIKAPSDKPQWGFPFHK